MNNRRIVVLQGLIELFESGWNELDFQRNVKLPQLALQVHRIVNRKELKRRRGTTKTVGRRILTVRSIEGSKQ